MERQMERLTDNEREDLISLSHSKGCTLDSESAHICGRLNNFATVRSQSKAVEYSWLAVRGVMKTSRQFKT